jgi:hypothetical protein
MGCVAMDSPALSASTLVKASTFPVLLSTCTTTNDFVATSLVVVTSEGTTTSALYLPPDMLSYCGSLTAWLMLSWPLLMGHVFEKTSAFPVLLSTPPSAALLRQWDPGLGEALAAGS